MEDRAGGILVPTRGEPLVLIPLSQPGAEEMQYALIDSADYPLVKDRKWFAYWNPTARSYYARTTTERSPKKRTLSLHRVLLGLAELGPGVDHANRLTLDNRRANLRYASRSQNGCNRGPQANNTSGFKGVSRKDNRWRAEIALDGRRYRLGCFDCPEDAAVAYDHAALQLHGSFARVNGV
jgi:hypothetical protein